MGFGFTSPVSGLAPIQIGWSGTLVPLRGTTLADGNNHKSHRESAGFQRQQGGNQTGSKNNAKAPASAGRGQPCQVGFFPSMSWDGQQWGLLVGGWSLRAGTMKDAIPTWSRSWKQVGNATKDEERTFSLLSGCHIAESRESHVCGIFLCTKKKAIIFMGFQLWKIFCYTNGCFSCHWRLPNDLVRETFLLCTAWK